MTCVLDPPTAEATSKRTYVSSKAFVLYDGSNYFPYRPSIIKHNKKNKKHQYSVISKSQKGMFHPVVTSLEFYFIYVLLLCIPELPYL